MSKRWILIADNYFGFEQKGIDMLYGAVSELLHYVLITKDAKGLTDTDIAENNLIIVGKLGSNTYLNECGSKKITNTPSKSEGYSIFVGESVFCKDNQMIVIEGYDEAGVLYGCVDFCNKYLGEEIFKNKDIWTDKTFTAPFEDKLNPWSISTASEIKRRAIWTWGHVIYDYRKFFENMAKIRLNEVVIWNDVLPINAKQVVEYAHSLNIKVIWGFSWGWGVVCSDILESYSKETLETLKRSVIEQYEKDYLPTNADGIYFQSFTELQQDFVGDKCVAELVTELVNEISGALLEKYPTLEIQFGLHATSVKKQLDHIKKVDKRFRIVWEDCGSFPYEYYADRVDNFEETLAFTSDILRLRGENEKFGIVAKGTLKLDWQNFEHFSGPYILGERNENYIKERQISKNKIWKLQQADWLKNAEYARRIVLEIANNSSDSVVQALVEDAMFENEIMLPIALFAEMLWTPKTDGLNLIGTVAKYPCVNFA